VLVLQYKRRQLEWRVSIESVSLCTERALGAKAATVGLFLFRNELYQGVVQIGPLLGCAKRTLVASDFSRNIPESVHWHCFDADGLLDVCKTVNSCRRSRCPSCTNYSSLPGHNVHVADIASVQADLLQHSLFGCEVGESRKPHFHFFLLHSFLEETPLRAQFKPLIVPTGCVVVYSGNCLYHADGAAKNRVEERTISPRPWRTLTKCMPRHSCGGTTAQCFQGHCKTLMYNIPLLQHPLEGGIYNSESTSSIGGNTIKVLIPEKLEIIMYYLLTRCSGRWS
jgi:hypothetical protein